MPTPRQGNIVWAEIPDPQGRNVKCRPCVVLTVDEDILADGEVVVVAVSGELDQAPPEFQVQLPWQRGGHPRTGLNKPSTAVCNWMQRIQVSTIQNISGQVSAAQLVQILRIVGQLEAGE